MLIVLVVIIPIPIAAHSGGIAFDIVLIMVPAWLRSHTDIFLHEVISCKVGHEILWRNKTSLFVVFLHDDLLQLLANSLSDLLEAESDGLVLVRTHILVELLVDLLNYSVAPRFNLFIYQLHCVVNSLNLLFLLLRIHNLDVQFVQLRVDVLCSFSKVNTATVFYLQLLQFGPPLVIVCTQAVNFVFVVSHLVQ